MKMKVVGDLALNEPNLMQIKVRHPNITGMAPLRIGSRVIPPAWFVDTLEIEYNGKLIVKALLTFSVSMDPALRFYFVPEKEGVMTVKGTDTKKNEFSSTHDINLKCSGSVNSYLSISVKLHLSMRHLHEKTTKKFYNRI